MGSRSDYAWISSLRTAAIWEIDQQTGSLFPPSKELDLTPAYAASYNGSRYARAATS